MNVEYYLGNAVVAQAEDGFSIQENTRGRKPPVGYDLDLLYVECRFCGKPVLWERGKTRLLLNASGLDTAHLDSECMLISDGCANCQPGTTVFHLQVVRVTALSPQDLLLFTDNKGHA